MTNALLLRLCALITCLAWPPWPAPANATDCTANSSGVSFGNYDPLRSGNTESTGSIHIACDEVVTASIALTAGSGSFEARTMTNGQSALRYNLYSDAQRSMVWGDGTGGAQPVSVTAETADVPVYGTIPGRQNVTAGSYGDTIAVTVTF